MQFEVGEINVVCTDLERSLRFYCDVLGFTPLDPEGPARHMECGNVKFLLLAAAENSRHAAPYCAVPGFSIDLIVDDLESAELLCRNHGVEFVSEFPANQDRFMIRDPDGLVLEILRRN
jgi:catechol 2,3-dioxygenase-like lactoylglutathione lyase family enzyme